MASKLILTAGLSIFAVISAVNAAASPIPVRAAPSIATENGPFVNVYDASPLPVTWPGRPKSKGAPIPPRPTSILPYGGYPEFASKYNPPAWIPKKDEQSLKGALSQGDTNGNSHLGLPDLAPIPDVLPGGSSKGQYSNVEPRPAADGSVDKRDTAAGSACGTYPDTGVTRTYNFEVSYQTISPDGVKKNGLVINGAFPGPLIEANWGDWVKVNVKNSLPNEGTSIHWHGLLQSETPWFDGVPAVSQCPIPPNTTYTYQWRADLYGSTWYHSHYSAQYAGGALGPIVIHGPKTAAYDIDLGPVMLSDWYHMDYFTLVNQTMHNVVVPSNNNLINGKMNYPCQNTTLPRTPNAGISKFRFTPGKKHRLRLINTSAEGTQKFSIDNHTLTVFANDFVPVVPYNTNVVTLGVGQRTDIIVQAKSQNTGAYFMRSNLLSCSFTDGVSPLAVAGVYYPGTNVNTVPSTTSDVTTSQLATCSNDDLHQTVAFCPIKPAAVAGTTVSINITFGSNGTSNIWFMNGESFRGDYNDPTLLAVKAGNTTFEKEWNVYNFGTQATNRAIVFNTFPFAGHPMHLHGHNFHVLNQGYGTWDGSIINANNTQRRDVQFLPPAKQDGTPSFIVLQWTNDNPGVWPFHCHIAWHVSAGLYINVLERIKGIQARNFPASSVQLCRSWWAYTGANVVDQIDSGL